MDVDPVDQTNVEAMIYDLMKKTGKVTVEVGERARVAAEAETEYRVAYAQAFLRAEGPVAMREAQATVECADQLHARKMADGLLLSAREAGLNARARLDAARTLASSLRSAMGSATGFGG